jgi:hypothetical protein
MFKGRILVLLAICVGLLVMPSVVSANPSAGNPYPKWDMSLDLLHICPNEYYPGGWGAPVLVTLTTPFSLTSLQTRKLHVNVYKDGEFHQRTALLPQATANEYTFTIMEFGEQPEDQITYTVILATGKKVSEDVTVNWPCGIPYPEP